MKKKFQQRKNRNKSNIITTQQTSLNIFVHDIETYTDDENGNCVPYLVGYIPVTKLSNPMVYRDNTDHEINDTIKKGNLCKGAEYFDKIINQINAKNEEDPKTEKNF